MRYTNPDEIESREQQIASDLNILVSNLNNFKQEFKDAIFKGIDIKSDLPHKTLAMDRYVGGTIPVGQLRQADEPASQPALASRLCRPALGSLGTPWSIPGTPLEGMRGGPWIMLREPRPSGLSGLRTAPLPCGISRSS